MIDSLANLVSKRLPIIGLAAYSIELPDRVLVTECFSKSLYPSSVAQMLSGVVRTGRTLLPAEQGAHYCWTFECFNIYIAARPDGICLALMAENSPGVQTVRIKALLNDFFEMQELPTAALSV